MQGIVRWDPAHQFAVSAPHVRARKFTSSDLRHKIKAKRKRRSKKGYN